MNGGSITCPSHRSMNTKFELLSVCDLRGVPSLHQFLKALNLLPHHSCFEFLESPRDGSCSKWHRAMPLMLMPKHSENLTFVFICVFQTTWDGRETWSQELFSGAHCPALTNLIWSEQNPVSASQSCLTTVWDKSSGITFLLLGKRGNSFYNLVGTLYLLKLGELKFWRQTHHHCCFGSTNADLGKEDVGLSEMK